MADPSQMYSLAMSGAYPDISQWSNPYSSFGGSGQMPGWPTGYVGAPMDAMGKPIQSYQAPAPQTAPPPSQGMTLNSSPNQWAINNAIINSMQPTLRGAPDGGGRGAYQGYDIGNIVQARALNGPNPNGGGAVIPGAPNAGAAPGMQPASQGSSYQSALTALAHPNQVQTPGAPWTPMGQQPNASNNVMGNFLQNWQQGGIGRQAAPGIGGGSSGISFGANNPFLKSLQGM